MGLTLDPGRLSEDGDTATASRSVPGCGASGVSPDAVRYEMITYDDIEKHIDLIEAYLSQIECFGD